jgi:hypothetical protein
VSGASLMVARTRLIETFTAAGIRAPIGGQFSAPCVLVEPGSPWAEPLKLGGGSARRTSHWRLTAIAGKVDTDQAFSALAELVDAIDVALRAAHADDGSPIYPQLPTWQRPGDLELGGVPYGASVADITLTI